MHSRHLVRGCFRALAYLSFNIQLSFTDDIHIYNFSKVYFLQMRGCNQTAVKPNDPLLTCIIQLLDCKVFVAFGTKKRYLNRIYSIDASLYSMDYMDARVSLIF